jgi:HEAT repeat protein
MSESAPDWGPLLKGLSDPDWELRARSAWTLGELASKAKAAVQFFLPLLKDPHWYVRGRCAWALAKIGSETDETVAALVEASKDVHWLVRAGAACALGRVHADAPAAVPALLDAVKDKDPYVRQNAAWALGQTITLARAGCLDTAVRQALMEALDDENHDVRAEANTALEALDLRA